jgi:ketosteroid isomerase-like protein
MKWPIRFALTAAALSFMLSVDVYIAGAQQRRLSADQAKIVSAVSAVYEAAAEDDLTKFHAVVAPGFYLYDAGKRLDGDEIMALIKSAHAQGKRYEWNVTEPDVHVIGNTAWIAYVNRGSITDQSGTAAVMWLESAFLERTAGIWKIDFMHSTRVPAGPPTSN